MSLTGKPGETKSITIGMKKWSTGGPPPTPPKPERLKLEKGMRIKIEGTLFKVIAARENGKVTIRPEEG